MENLTFGQKLVVNPEGLDPAPGYVVVLFEKLRGGGVAFSRLIYPGERFQTPGIRFGLRRHEYFSVAVSQSVLSYSFEERIVLDDATHQFTLKFHLKYRAADPRRVAERREQDPLRRLRDLIAGVVGGSCARRTWGEVSERFTELKVVVLNSERAGLVRHAAELGLEIVSLELDERLPEAGEEVRRARAGERQLEIEKRKLEHDLSARKGRLEEELEMREEGGAADVDALRRRLRDSLTGAATTALGNVADAVDSPREFEEAFGVMRRIIETDQPDAHVGAHLSERGPGGTGRSGEGTFKEVKFTAYYHSELRPAAWYTLLVYAHVPEASKAVDADSRSRIDRRASGLKSNAITATKALRRGAEIVVIPEMPGCRFNPPRASLLWLEDWHRVEFRMQADPEQPGFEYGRATNGRLAFYVGAVLIAELKFWAHYSDEVDTASDAPPDNHVAADPYEAVFVSYSHEDALVVDGLERAYEALGFQYIRDVNTLRSGEKWNQALLKKIEEADIFQLCWSAAGKRSRYVRQEWRHALALGRPNFIRPTYWQRPMPKPPSELASLHFAYYEIN